MIEIIKELNIEVSKPNVFQAVVAKQYDMNTRFIKATFVDYGDKITIPQSDTLKVVINALRNDGEAKGFDGVINDDGTVTVPLHSWMLELVGTVICDISVIDTEADDNKKLTTTSFTLLVEQASWGGNGMTNDPQYDVLIELLNRVDTAGELAEEALAKSNVADAKYDACVDATQAAIEAVASASTINTEWRNEIDATNARIDELANIKPVGLADKFEYVDDHIKIVITTNGAVADLIVIPLDVTLNVDTELTRPIPAALAPFDEQVPLQHSWGNDVNASLYRGQDGDDALLSITNCDGELTDTAHATYDLAYHYIPELTDIRVGADGVTVYDSAGAAVRGQFGALNEELRNACTGYDGTQYESLGKAIRGQINELHEQVVGIEPALDAILDMQNALITGIAKLPEAEEVTF